MRIPLAGAAILLAVVLADTPLSFASASMAAKVSAAMPQEPARPVIPKSQYLMIRNLSLRLLQEYPPQLYHYVGVGASPGPIIAFLQQAGFDASSLPFSRDSHFQAMMAGPSADPELRARVFEHLRRYLPHEGSAGKKLLFLDYVSSGGTFANLKVAMEELMKQSGTPPRPVEYVGIFQRVSEQTRLPPEVHQLVPEKPLLHLLEDFVFDELREFPRWIPTQGVSSATFTRSARYSQLLKSMGLFISHDEKLLPVLDKFNRTATPGLVDRCASGFRRLAIQLRGVPG